MSNKNNRHSFVTLRLRHEQIQKIFWNPKFLTCVPGLVFSTTCNCNILMWHQQIGLCSDRDRYDKSKKNIHFADTKRNSSCALKQHTRAYTFRDKKNILKCIERVIYNLVLDKSCEQFLLCKNLVKMIK